MSHLLSVLFFCLRHSLFVSLVQNICLFIRHIWSLLIFIQNNSHFPTLDHSFLKHSSLFFTDFIPFFSFFYYNIVHILSLFSIHFLFFIYTLLYILYLILNALLWYSFSYTLSLSHTLSLFVHTVSLFTLTRLMSLWGFCG